MYGSSNLTEKPAGGTLAAYTACFPKDHVQNLHVKTIANLRHTVQAGAGGSTELSFSSPHGAHPRHRG